MPKNLRAVLSTLHDIADLRLVWRRGLLHPGGPHRRIAGMRSPISIGEDECLALGKVIAAFRPRDCFIIGNAFGLSSNYIALTMAAHGGRSVVTLDSQAEGDGKKCAAIASQLAERLGPAMLKHKKGVSPQDTPAAVEAEVHQLIFIDGYHADPQVTLDFEGLLPYADEQTIFVWHDFWMRGIPQCIAAARERHFHCLWIPTSCEMVWAARDLQTFEKLQALFPDGDDNRAARSWLGFAWASFKSVIYFIYEAAVQCVQQALRPR